MGSGKNQLSRLNKNDRRVTRSSAQSPPSLPTPSSPKKRAKPIPKPRRTSSTDPFLSADIPASSTDISCPLQPQIAIVSTTPPSQASLLPNQLPIIAPMPPKAGSKLKLSGGALTFDAIGAFLDKSNNTAKKKAVDEYNDVPEEFIDDSEEDEPGIDQLKSDDSGSVEEFRAAEDVTVEVMVVNRLKDFRARTDMKYSTFLRKVAEKFGVGTTHLSDLGYTLSFSPKNPKPVPKEISDEESYLSMMVSVEKWIQSQTLAKKRLGKVNVTITISDLSEPSKDTGKKGNEKKVCRLSCRVSTLLLTHITEQGKGEEHS